MYQAALGCHGKPPWASGIFPSARVRGPGRAVAPTLCHLPRASSSRPGAAPRSEAPAPLLARLHRSGPACTTPSGRSYDAAVSADSFDRSPAVPETRDWPAQAADSIVEVVDTVRAKTTDRVVLGARWVVFGFLITTLVMVGLVSLLIGLLRGSQVGLVNIADAVGVEVSHARSVWISYLVMGTIFVAAGSFIWHLANRQASKSVAAEGASA